MKFQVVKFAILSGGTRERNKFEIFKFLPDSARLPPKITSLTAILIEKNCLRFFRRDKKYRAGRGEDTAGIYYSNKLGNARHAAEHEDLQDKRGVVLAQLGI